MAPVALHAVADFGNGVTARIASVKAVHADAVGPGEVSGPGLRIVMEITNSGTRAINLDNAVVTIADAQGTPGLMMVFTPQTPGEVDDDVPAVSRDSFSYPMTGSLAPRKKASGTYVFTIPTGHRNPVTVNFSYAGGAPVVLFKGDAA